MVAIAGFSVSEMSADELLGQLEQCLLVRRPVDVFFANTNFVVKCRSLQEPIATAPVVLVNDGLGMDLASRLLRGRKFRENLNGTDFVPRLLAHFSRPLRVYLLGAQPAVVARAAAIIGERYGHQVVGYCDGYAPGVWNGDVAREIAQLEVDVLLVAMGNPLQERWLLEQGGNSGVPLRLAVGALFDFMAGHARRAPGWVRRLRMEWLFRLAQEPRRLLARYTIDVLVFFFYCLASKVAGREPA